MPNSLMRPDAGRRSPRRTRRSVVLPDPLGPMMPRKSPGQMHELAQPGGCRLSLRRQTADSQLYESIASRQIPERGVRGDEFFLAAGPQRRIKLTVQRPQLFLHLRGIGCVELAVLRVGSLQSLLDIGHYPRREQWVQPDVWVKAGGRFAGFALVDPLDQRQSITGVYDHATCGELGSELFYPRLEPCPVVDHNVCGVERGDVLRARFIIMGLRPRRHERHHAYTLAADPLGELLQGVKCHHHRQGLLDARGPRTAQRGSVPAERPEPRATPA